MLPSCCGRSWWCSQPHPSSCNTTGRRRKFGGCKQQVEGNNRKEREGVEEDAPGGIRPDAADAVEKRTNVFVVGAGGIDDHEHMSHQGAGSNL